MVLSGKNNMMTKLKENIEQVLLEEDTTTIDSIDAKLEELQQELIKRAGARQDYEDLADEIDNLREQRLNAMTEKAECESMKMRIKGVILLLEKFVREVEESILQNVIL